MTKKKNHRTAQPAAPSGKSTAQRQTGTCAGEHDEHRIVIQLERFLNIGAAIATIIAFFVAVWQVAIGNWQFERSGPDYSGFIVQGSITSGAQVTDSTFSIQPAFAVVISNTGRTGDSILLIEQQDSGKSHPMQACIPNIDTNGNLDTSDPIKPRCECGGARVHGGEPCKAVGLLAVEHDAPPQRCPPESRVSSLFVFQCSSFPCQ